MARSHRSAFPKNNPYNFVPGDKPIKIHPQSPKLSRFEGLSGHIECLLTNETPLMVALKTVPTGAKSGDKVWIQCEKVEKYVKYQKSKKLYIPGPFYLIIDISSTPKPGYTEGIYKITGESIKKDKYGKSIKKRERIFFPADSSTICFFSKEDAEHVSGSGETTDYLDLKVLGTPYPTSYNFYLIDPNTPSKFRNYDGHEIVTNRGKIDRTKTGDVKLRGRKFYYHHPNYDDLQKYCCATGTPAQLYSRAKPVLKGNTFRFQVHFRNLSTFELGLLKLWMDYDEEADILYMTFKKPSRVDDSEMTDDGIILRYEGDELVGITILNASQYPLAKGS